MPGYIMHLTEAEQILDSIRGQMHFSYKWEQAFLTGALLPDTRLKGEKQYSHFWNPEHLELLALSPDLDRFLDKYRTRLMQPVMLGYLAHLHLDACYLKNCWPAVIEFYGAEGEPEERRDRITDVEIRHLNRKVPVEQFFSPEYYYGEYTKLNGYFIDKYHLKVPEWELVDDFDMDEVRLQDMEYICGELAHLLTLYHAGDERAIQVFDLEDLEQFLAETAHAFARVYGTYLAASAAEERG